MGRDRLLLQEIFRTILGADTSVPVYFQPPPNLTMEYPCIVYNQDYADVKYAGNGPYAYTKRYQVTVIDKKPDSLISDGIAKLPLCTFGRWFASENLNHYIYNLYF